jgi:hypothetical protein
VLPHPFERGASGCTGGPLRSPCNGNPRLGISIPDREIPRDGGSLRGVFRQAGGIMPRGKAKRRMLWIGSTLLTLLVLLYLLRWPLLEGLILRELRRRIAGAIHAELAVGTLGGTLLSTAWARNLSLSPQPGSVVRAGTVQSIDARYGFLGRSGVHVVAKGVRLELAASDLPKAPLNDVVRDVLAEVQGIQLNADVELFDATVILSDGLELGIDYAHVDGRKASARIRALPLGSIQVAVERGAKHALRLEGVVQDGPIRRLLVDLSPADSAAHPLRIQGLISGETVEWTGTARFDAQGRLDSVDGELQARTGRASTRVDLVSGALEADLDAGFSFEKPVAVEIRGRGRFQGSLAEPVERWRVSSGFIALDSAMLRGCPLRGEVSFSEGTLKAVPWKGSLRCNQDRLEAEGTISWKDELGLRAQFKMEVGDLSSYSGILPEGVQAQVHDLCVKGTMEVNPSGPLLEGVLQAGAGTLQGITWKSMDVSARVTPTKLDVCLATLQGLPVIQKISVSGTAKVVEGTQPREIDIEASIPSLTLTAPVGDFSDLQVRGRLDGQGARLESLEGRLDYGRFRVMGRWDFLAQTKPLRLHLLGENLLVLAGKLQRIRASPDLWLTGTPDQGWTLGGSITLPSILYYEELGSPGTGHSGTVKAAAAPKLRLTPSIGGGFELPLGFPGTRSVGLDVEVRTTNKARIENSGLGSMVDAELHLGGTLESPAVSGKARTSQGEVKLSTGLFIRIERAELTLPTETGKAATLYFRGHSGKGEGAITLVIAGPLEDPAMTLSSNPPRKQEELLAALAFGRLPGAASGQDALGTVATKLFESATDSWPRADPQESGFWQRFNLSMTTEDAPDPDKRLPWNLPPTGSARGTIVRTEYLLNSFLSVVVESDRQANVSGDFKVRLHFR